MESHTPIVILHVMPSWGVGGVQLRILDVARRLGAGFVHRALSLDGRHEALSRVAEGLDVRRVEPPAGAKGGLRATRNALRRLFESEAIDLLCTYNWGAIEWALANRLLVARRPHLHFESGFGPEEARRPLRRRSLMRRLSLGAAHALVVPSRTLRRIAQASHWIAAKRIRLIPNGVDTDHFAPPGERNREPGAPMHIVAVAPLRREKRLDRLLATAAPLLAAGRCRLSVLGEGAERAALERQAGDLGIAARVRFAGNVSDIRPALAEADIFALSSETEQMPNALLQAMAMALPVVAFDAGDVAHILPPAQRQFVRAQGDEEGFRAALAQLCGDGAQRRALGRANRDHVVVSYPMARMVDAYRQLYEEAVAA
ncbi:MAG: glycosyltransferase [Alphaproteobacteria bacterium]|nr:MAG: glycosyltransferase [Alphaproteobacteria bacterium]